MDRALRELEETGVTVVPDVIPLSDCDTYVTELKQWVRGFGNGFPKNRRSLIQQYGIAHHPAAWKTRLQAKKVFAGVWGTDKLHTSMDGIAIGKPPSLEYDTFAEENPGLGNLHLDQGPTKKGLHAYQGAVYLEEATDEDWCFMVIERSHKHFEEFYNTFHTRSKSEFRKLTTPEQAWLEERGCTVRRVAVPKGGIVLWDSRLVHTGAPPMRKRKNPNRWRFIVFASMTPAFWSRDVDTAERVRGYRTLRCSRHWSSLHFSLFKEYKGTRHDVTTLPDEALTVEARKLVGDLAYDFNDAEPNGPTWTPETEELRPAAKK